MLRLIPFAPAVRNVVTVAVSRLGTNGEHCDRSARHDRLSSLSHRVPAPFPDERACADYLAATRWPEGFRCPACGRDKGWELITKPFTWECAGCGRQTSLTAGTVMHGSKLALTVWFWAAYLMATHSNGISALQC